MDIFIRQYDSGGVEIWTQQLGSTGEEEANAITADAQGHIFVTGYFTGTFRDQRTLGEEDVFLLFSE